VNSSLQGEQPAYLTNQFTVYQTLYAAPGERAIASRLGRPISNGSGVSDPLLKERRLALATARRAQSCARLKATRSVAAKRPLRSARCRRMSGHSPSAGQSAPGRVPGRRFDVHGKGTARNGIRRRNRKARRQLRAFGARRHRHAEGCQRGRHHAWEVPRPRVR